MCLIIDANSAASLFNQNQHPDAVPVFRWLEQGPGRLVYGGKLTDELSNNTKVGRWLLSLLRAGRATQIPSALIDVQIKAVQATGQCKSNDQHILGLARASGARLLFSRDQDLHADFTNRHLINTPRGSVYQKAGHQHLFRKKLCRIC